VDAGEDDRGGFVELAFGLPKGAYATSLLREVMKADDARRY
jgi:tRNA(Glu) U13 pseudouridine synthase TruD